MAANFFLQGSSCIPVRADSLREKTARKLDSANRNLGHLHPPTQSLAGDLDLDTPEGLVEYELRLANLVYLAVHGI